MGSLRASTADWPATEWNGRGSYNGSRSQTAQLMLTRRLVHPAGATVAESQKAKEWGKAKRKGEGSGRSPAIHRTRPNRKGFVTCMYGMVHAQMAIVPTRTYHRTKSIAVLGKVALSSEIRLAGATIRTRVRAAVVRVEVNERKEGRTDSPGLQGQRLRMQRLRLSRLRYSSLAQNPGGARDA